MNKKVIKKGKTTDKLFGKFNIIILSFIKALKGHIIEGESLSSTEIYSVVLKYTYGGQRVMIQNLDSGKQN